MSTRNNREKNRRKDEAEWISDEEYQESRGSEEDWRSDNEWNEDSSLAGEASVMSEGTEEEQPEEEEEKLQKNKRPKKHQITKPSNKLNFDDVGTEDDGESRHPEDITERTDGKYSKTNVSDISDLSDIEDQIAEAHNKFMDDKQSLSGVMGLVDEVTIRGENLTRKASETSLVVERDTLKKGVLSNDQLSLFDDDEISFRSYTERTNLDEDNIPQRDLGKMTSGRIEYINYGEKEERSVPKLTLGLGHIEYLDENKSNDSGSLISERVNSSISKNVDHAIKDATEDGKSETSERSTVTGKSERSTVTGESERFNVTETSERINVNEASEKFNVTEADDLSKKVDHATKDATEDGKSETTESSNVTEADDLQSEDDKEEDLQPSEQEDEIQEQSISPEPKEFDDPECSKFGEKHLCCFINLGGGGDDGRGDELVKRLKKLKDDIANIRKELSLARQECKKESEEVAKLIEEAAARNRAAEQNEIALPTNSSNMVPAYNSSNYALEEVIPTSLMGQATILTGRSQVAIPTSLLEDRLRTTRQTASSTYRQSLNELERMVEKEMASIKDSMIRLEPLNKIAAEWDDALPVRDPKRTTYKRDYRLEMVTSEMRLQAPEAQNVAIQEVK